MIELRALRRQTWLWVLAFSVCLIPRVGDGVDIIVKEGFGIDRKGYPVNVQVPFARGALKSPDSLTLAGPRGEPVPFQAQVITRWGDESVQWLRIDFPADIASEGSAVYKLSEAASPHRTPSPEGGLSVTEMPDYYRVTARGLDVDVYKDVRNMLRSARAGVDEVLRGDPGGLTVRKGASGVNVEVTGNVMGVESSGELRAAFVSNGELKYLLKSDKPSPLDKLFRPRPEFIRTRVCVERFAGVPWIRQSYRFARSLQDIWVLCRHRLDLGGAPIHYDLCPYTKFSGTLGPDEAVTVTRNEALLRAPIPAILWWDITAGPRYTPEKRLLRGFVPGTHLDRKMEMGGWAALNGKGRGVIVAFHDFWQGDAKSITLFGDGQIQIGIHLRPTVTLPVISTEEDRWATTSFTYALFSKPIENAEAEARSIVGGVSVQCPSDYYSSCGVKMPAEGK